MDGAQRAGAALRARSTRLELIADTYLSVGTPVQVAAPQLLIAGAGRASADSSIACWRTTARLTAVAAPQPPAEVLRAEGGWSAVVRIPHTMPEDERVIAPARATSTCSSIPDISSTSRVTATSSSACCRDPTCSAPPSSGFSPRGRGRMRAMADTPASRPLRRPGAARCSRCGRHGTGASARSATSPALGAWLDRGGLPALQLLPVSTLPAGESSPYSALSAMAIDPVYITLDDVHDFRALGGDIRLPLADQIALRTARAAPRVDYANVRQAKQSALTLAFSYFWDVDWVRTTARAGSFAAFCLLGRVVARRLRPLLRAPGSARRTSLDASGPIRCAIGSPRRSTPPGASSSARFSSTSTRSGWPTSSGPPHANSWATCGCSATSRSWSASTAPTSGPTSTCFNSIGPPARRPTRSAPPARTGGCRSTAGT